MGASEIASILGFYNLRRTQDFMFYLFSSHRLLEYSLFTYNSAPGIAG